MVTASISTSVISDLFWFFLFFVFWVFFPVERNMPPPVSKSSLDLDSYHWHLFKALSLIWGPRRADLQYSVSSGSLARKGAEHENVPATGKEASLSSCSGSKMQEAGPAVKTPIFSWEEPGPARRWGSGAWPQSMRWAGGGVRMRERNK